MQLDQSSDVLEEWPLLKMIKIIRNIPVTSAEADVANCLQ